MRSLNWSVTIAVMTGILTVLGCQSANRKVEERTAQETPALGPNELASRGFEAWASSVSLSSDKKSKLWTIQSDTAREAIRIRGEISKAKSAMFKELAKGQYDEELIEGLKRKIVKLDSDRLDVMFKALASVEAVLERGHESKEYYRYLEELEIYGESWHGRGVSRPHP